MPRLKPIKRWRTQGIDVTIWKAMGKQCWATVEKQFIDEEGNCRKTTQWSAADLLVLSELAKQAALDMVKIDWYKE